MAKKKAGGAKANTRPVKKKVKPKSDAQRQGQFEGPGFPEKPPKAVLDARDQYITAMRDASDARKRKGDREQNLLEKMKENGIDRPPRRREQIHRDRSHRESQDQNDSSGTTQSS